MESGWLKMLTFSTIFETVQEVKKDIKKNWKTYAKHAGAFLGSAALGYGAYKLGHGLYTDHKINQLKQDIRSDETKEKDQKDSKEAIEKGYKQSKEQLEYDKQHPTEWKIRKAKEDFPNNVEYGKWKAKQLKEKITGGE
jgi:hypothetical protein